MALALSTSINVSYDYSNIDGIMYGLDTLKERTIFQHFFEC